MPKLCEQKTTWKNSALLGILAAIILALFVTGCNGEGQTPDALGPAATLMPTNTTPPSPTPEATPVSFHIPEPAPGDVIACSNGTAVPNPENNPELVNDCAILLGARDVLLGEVSSLEPYELDWSPHIPIGEWRGISIRGGRVTSVIWCRT